MMPWARFDDHFPVNRKVEGLTDTAFRLHVSAIIWCVRNLMDGVVPEGDLELVTARVRAPARFSTELVRRGLWHEAGYECGSDNCPPSGPDGWVIHDYFEFQPTKEQELAKKASNAERQRQWRERNALHGLNNGSSNGVTNRSSNSPPSRPVSKESSSNSLTGDDVAAFDEFWAVYPRRKAKDAARKAYTAALKRGGHEEILAGAVAYRDECRGDRRAEQYIAHASTWLNQGRWKDHLEQQQHLFDDRPRSFLEN